MYRLNYLCLGIHSNPTAAKQQIEHTAVCWHSTKGVAESLHANKIRDGDKWCHEGNQRALPGSRNLQESEGPEHWAQPHWYRPERQAGAPCLLALLVISTAREHAKRNTETASETQPTRKAKPLFLN